MKITRIKILKYSSRAKLSHNTNLYMENIERLGASIIGRPELKIVNLDKNRLSNYIKRVEIKNYNKSHKYFSLKTDLPLKKVRYVNKDLANRIKKEINNIEPLSFYSIISYIVDSKILRAHPDIFN